MITLKYKIELKYNAEVSDNSLYNHCILPVNLSDNTVDTKEILRNQSQIPYKFNTQRNFKNTMLSSIVNYEKFDSLTTLSKQGNYGYFNIVENLEVVFKDIKVLYNEDVVLELTDLDSENFEKIIDYVDGLNNQKIVEAIEYKDKILELISSKAYV